MDRRTTSGARRRGWPATAAGVAVAALALGCGASSGSPAAGTEVGGVADGAERRWTSDVEADGVVDAVALGDITVLQTFDDPTEPEIVADNLVAIDEDGGEAWRVDDAAIVDGGADETGFLVDRGSGDFNDPAVARFDLDGEEVWSATGVDPVALLGDVVVVADAEGDGVRLLDRRSGEEVVDLEGRYAASDDERVVLVDGGDVAAYDASGAEQWRTTVDDGFGEAPTSPTLEDLRGLGDIDPDTPEGRRELRQLRRDNAELRRFTDGERAYFGADADTTIEAAVGDELVYLSTANDDPTDPDPGSGLGSAFGDPFVEAAYVGLDPADGSVLVERTDLDGTVITAEDLPRVRSGAAGDVIVGEERLTGPDAESAGTVPSGADVVADGGRYLTEDGLLLDAGLDEVADLGEEPEGVCDDGVYTLDGEDVVLTGWDGEELARLAADGPGSVLPVDGGVVVRVETEPGTGGYALYR